MKIVISGASGLIGSHLYQYLQKENHEVYKLVRRTPVSNNDIFWDPYSDTTDELAKALDSISPDVVIHLSGESILGVWTEHKKQMMRKSRVETTKYLANVICRMHFPPSIFICASGVSIYGHDTHNQLIDEDAPVPALNTFLADLSREWEQASVPATPVIKDNKPIRVVNLRIGPVIDPSGGMLGSMLVPYKLCLGGVLGDGTQWQSWISLNDLIRAIVHIIYTEQLSGPINLVTPNPVTNYEFTKTLGKVLGRPTLCWVPTFVLKASSYLLGDIIDEGPLASIKVYPKRLLDSGFRFQDADFETALRRMLA